MFTVHHDGLFFTQEHIASAQQLAAKEPLVSAFARLQKNDPADAVSPLWQAYHYVFRNDLEAGERALLAIEAQLDSGVVEDMPYLDAVAETLMCGQVYEMIRQHPALSFVRRAGWINRFEERVNTLATSVYKDSYVENLWMAALVVGAGVILEREDIFQIGVEVFQNAVAFDVRPQGFIPRAIEGGGGGAMYRQLASVSALSLIAEVASHVGVDLWGYENRGISVITAAIYPIYYFYTTEKWLWDKELAPEDVQMWFRRFGGYLEFVKRRTNLRDLNPLLEDLRPIFTPLAGGFTTLTHGIALPRPRRGLFG